MAKQVVANVGMVVQKAKEAYARLPQHTKNWLQLEDFIQEGLLEGMTVVARRYNPNKGAKFSTFLYTGLELFFKNLLEPHYADMRYEGRTSAIEDLAPNWERKISADQHYEGTCELFASGEWNRKFSTEESFAGTHFKAEVSLDIQVTTNHSAERTLIAVLREASPQLRNMMVKWFIQPKETKYHVTGQRFQSAQEEFLSLCQKHNVTKDACFAAMQSAKIKSELARSLQQLSR
jgi:hypothetical protein